MHPGARYNLRREFAHAEPAGDLLRLISGRDWSAMVASTDRGSGRAGAPATGPQQAGVVDDEGRVLDRVEVNAVLAHDIDHVWSVLTTNDGAEALLGEGARLGSKGEHWRAADGTHGFWRSYHPMEQVRVSWHASEDAPRSLQLPWMISGRP